MNAKHCLAVALFSFSISLVSGCANRYRFETDAPNYAGRADLTVRVNKTELRELTMQLEHLAPPRRIDPSLQGYVAWISVPGHGTAKLGRIEYDEKKREGSLVATSAFDKFEVLVTLESDLSSDAPSDRVVLRRVVGKG